MKGMHFMVQKRKDFGPDGWDGVMPGAEFDIVKADGANHFTLMVSLYHLAPLFGRLALCNSNTDSNDRQRNKFILSESSSIESWHEVVTEVWYFIVGWHGNLDVWRYVHYRSILKAFDDTRFLCDVSCCVNMVSLVDFLCAFGNAPFVFYIIRLFISFSYHCQTFRLSSSVTHFTKQDSRSLRKSK